MAGGNYRITPTCYHCAHCFELYEWEEYNEYYCTLNALPRPKCDSHAMDEGHLCRLTEWLPWAEVNRVSVSGLCDAWQPAERDEYGELIRPTTDYTNPPPEKS